MTMSPTSAHQRDFNRQIAAAAGVPGRILLFGIVTMTAVVLALVVAGTLFTGHLAVQQGKKNEQHIDCIIAVLFRQDAPKCMGVKEQLVRDQILPAVLPPLPSTTTTTQAP